MDRKDGMNEVFLCLGGNLGDRLRNIELAVNEIANHCGRIIETSSIYETAPWGTHSSNAYLNMVIKIATGLAPEELLERLRATETFLGRKRSEHQYADREMDIDILFYDNEIISQTNLKIPHPRLHERKFTLIPLAEIDETLIHPAFNLTVKQLLEQCPDQQSVERYHADGA